jgi:hypothetical protein
MTDPADDRRSPLVAQLILVALFGLFVAVGVFTVLIPELSDAGETEDGAAGAETGSDGASPQAPDPDAPTPD